MTAHHRAGAAALIADSSRADLLPESELNVDTAACGVCVFSLELWGLAGYPLYSTGMWVNWCRFIVFFHFSPPWRSVYLRGVICHRSAWKNLQRKRWLVSAPPLVDFLFFFFVIQIAFPNHNILCHCSCADHDVLPTDGTWEGLCVMQGVFLDATPRSEALSTFGWTLLFNHFFAAPNNTSLFSVFRKGFFSAQTRFPHSTRFICLCGGLYHDLAALVYR